MLTLIFLYFKRQ